MHILLVLLLKPFEKMDLVLDRGTADLPKQFGPV
jgi:hypothetical protein